MTTCTPPRTRPHRAKRGRAPRRRRASGRQSERQSFSLNSFSRIGAADLQAIGFADGRDIEPVRGVIDILEWPVGREQDAVGADLEDCVDQRLGAEIAGRGDPEIFLEILGEFLLRRILRRDAGPAIAVVAAPDACRAGLRPYGRARSLDWGKRRTDPSTSAAANAPRSPGRRPRSGRAARDARHRSLHRHGSGLRGCR